MARVMIMTGELKFTENLGDYTSASASASVMVRLEAGDDVHAIAAEMQEHLKDRVASQLSVVPGSKFAKRERDLGLDPALIQPGDINIQIDEVTGRYVIYGEDENADQDLESDE